MTLPSTTDGVTNGLAVTKTTKINWKDADKALTKLYPRDMSDDDDEGPVDAGSFFNFFELEKDPYDVCIYGQSIDVASDKNTFAFVTSDWHDHCQRNLPRGDRLLPGASWW